MSDQYKETYKGYTISIGRDEAPLSPDEMGENVTFLVSHHRQFSVSPPSWVIMKKKRWIGSGSRRGPLLMDARRWKRMPLYAYIHSGVSLSLTNTEYPFNDRWDACQVGEVFVRRTKGVNAKEAVKGYIQAWNDYLNELVWVFTITDEAGEVVESCGGIYGDMSYVMGEAREVVDSLLEIQAPDAFSLYGSERAVLEYKQRAQQNNALVEAQEHQAEMEKY